jgi:hypothetical protein
MGLDEILWVRSNEGYRIYKEPVENQLADPRIKRARQLVERTVFARFLENYGLSLEGFEVTKPLEETLINGDIVDFFIEEPETG